MPLVAAYLQVFRNESHFFAVALGLPQIQMVDHYDYQGERAEDGPISPNFFPSSQELTFGEFLFPSCSTSLRSPFTASVLHFTGHTSCDTYCLVLIFNQSILQRITSHSDIENWVQVSIIFNLHWLIAKYIV
jgi:hypothetical protein